MDQQIPGGQIQSSVNAILPPESPKKSPIRSFIKIVIILVLTVGLGALGYIIYITFETPGIQKSEKPNLPIGAADTLIETADTFSGQVLNQDIWFTLTSSNLPQLQQAEGKFTIQIPGDIDTDTAAFIGTKGRVRGDFQASVDVNIVSGSLNSWSAFIFHDFTEEWLNRLAIYLDNEADGNILIRVITLNNGQGKVIGYETVPNSGYLTLRITRTGSSVKMTVGDSVISEDANAYTGEGGFSLHVESRIPSSSTVISSFDNFIIHSL